MLFHYSHIYINYSRAVDKISMGNTISRHIPNKMNISIPIANRVEILQQYTAKTVKITIHVENSKI